MSRTTLETSLTILHDLNQNQTAEELNKGGIFISKQYEKRDVLRTFNQNCNRLPNSSFARPETDVTKAAWAA